MKIIFKDEVDMEALEEKGQFRRRNVMHSARYVISFPTVYSKTLFSGICNIGLAFNLKKPRRRPISPGHGQNKTENAVL